MQSTISRATEQMVLIRVLEEELQELCDQGLAGDLHMNRGQEAVSVGVISALRDTDYVVTHHRSIAHAVAKGIPLYPLVAELLGKPDGLNGGIAGEMHMNHDRFIVPSQIVSTCVPVAAGMAWAVKNVHKTDDIVVVFHGDAATANGQFHEGMNLAAVQQVPLLVICENNGLAGNVRPEHYQPVHDVKDRVSGYGIGSGIAVFNDVQEIHETVTAAAGYVRANSKPFFLECRTTRLSKHKQGQGDMRSKEEMEELKLRDPLRDVPESAFIEARKQVRSIIDMVI